MIYIEREVAALCQNYGENPKLIERWREWTFSGFANRMAGETGMAGSHIRRSDAGWRSGGANDPGMAIRCNAAFAKLVDRADDRVIAL